MNYVQLDTFLIAWYVIVDDGYKRRCALRQKPGPLPKLSDSEVLTLTPSQQLLGFETERAFLAFAWGNLRHLFPRLLDQSQFNRRVRALAWALDQIRQQAPMEIAVSFFWMLISVSALLIAVGALLVFLKLARFLDRMEERFKE